MGRSEEGKWKQHINIHNRKIQRRSKCRYQRQSSELKCWGLVDISEGHMSLPTFSLRVRQKEGVQGLSLMQAWLTSKLAYPPKPKVCTNANEQRQKLAKGGLSFKLWRVHKTIIKLSEYEKSNWGVTAVFWEQRQTTKHTKKEVMLALPYIRESAEQEATGHWILM